MTRVNLASLASQTRNARHRAARSAGRAILGAALALATAPAALAQGDNPLQSPEGRALLGRGWDPTKLYDAGDVDAISLLNGGLSLALPIGLGYPLAGGSTFGLSLVYSSSVWDFETYTAEMITWSSPIPPQDLCGQYTQKWPSWTFNAGLGWRLSLGMLHAPGRELVVCDQTNDESRPSGCVGDPPRAEGVPVNSGIDTAWRYDAPDGSSHNFFAELHAGVPAPPGDPSLYSKDSTYLRLRDVPGVPGGQKVVEMPDGSRRFFQPDPTDLDETAWRPVRIEDPFGNWVNIAYSAGGNTWTLTDLHNRVYTLEFWTPEQTFPGHPNPDHIRALSLLHQVTLPGADGNDLIYRLNYQVETPEIPRACGDNYPWGQTSAWPPSVSYERYVALLESVELPDGSTYAFTYHAESCDDAYLLASATLPTGGRVEWDFQTYSFPSAVACRYPGDPQTESHQCSMNNDPSSFSQGVAERRVYERDEELRGRWTYDQDLGELWGPLHCMRPLESRTRVTDPLGHQQAHYFSVYVAAALLGTPTGQPNAPDGGWTRAEFGLPFTRRVTQTPLDGGAPHFLSSETLDCANTVLPGSGDDPLACTPRSLLATRFVRYQVDDPAGGCNTPDHLIPIALGCSNLQPRVVASRLQHHGAGGGTVDVAETAYSDFDGLGHFRRSRERGDFCEQGLATIRRAFCRGDDRETFVNYSPERGSLGNPNFVMPEEGDRWLWTTYTERSVIDRSAAQGQPTFEEKSLFTFDRSNGFLQERRTFADNLAPAQPNAATDVAVRLTPRMVSGRATGEVETEEWFGGDLSLLTGTPEYRVRHTYDHGVLATSIAEDPSDTANTLSLVNNTAIDPDTGFVERSVDAAGVGVSYTYDSASRLSQIAPDGEVATVISYRLASSSDSARVTMTRDGGGNLLTTEHVDFDGFGRVSHQRRLLPDGTFSLSCREVYASGLPHRESTTQAEATECAEETFTLYPDYDALGRPQRVVFPGHTPTARRRQFHDWTGAVSLKLTTEHVARQDAAGQLVFADEVRYQHFDRLDRMWRVVERSAGPGGAGERETFYRLDGADRLIAVRGHEAAEAGSNDCVAGVCQDRTFTYDGRGFLRAETHPEALPVTYSNFDSRGNAGRRIDGSTDLAFAYDFAGRLLQVKWGSEPLQRFWWAAKNRNPPGGPGSSGTWSTNGSDKTAGRLVQTMQWHWLDRSGLSGGQDVWASETFSYQGLGGRLSSYSVRSFSGYLYDIWDYPSMRFTSGLAYDTLGSLKTLTYPTCAGTGRCPPSQASRQVTHTFKKGWLTGVADGGRTYAADVRYHPSGQFREIVHGNGVSERRDQPPDALPRPLRIYTTGAAGGDWDTGTYHYDAAGNIYQIGTAASSKDEYFYDPVNRLTEARLRSHGGGLREQSYDYDPFGNLVRVEDGSGVVIDLPVDTETNRLAYASYDNRGNLISHLNFAELEWDPLGRLTSAAGSGINRQYLYTASGERLAVFDNLPSGCSPNCPTQRETWTVRGPGQKVLRELERELAPSGAVTWSEKDYVYRGGSLLASVSGSEVRHFHLDHLGSPRLATDGAGTRRAFHLYFPFGREVTARHQDDDERMKFTGHERDFQTEGEISGDPESDDLDYMHARYYSPWMGRFLSGDPVTGVREAAQTWNRYAYVLNNPLRLVDPDGRRIRQIYLEGSSSSAELKAAIIEALRYPAARSNFLDMAAATTKEFRFSPTHNQSAEAQIPLSADGKNWAINVDLDKHGSAEELVDTIVHESLHGSKLARGMPYDQVLLDDSGMPGRTPAEVFTKEALQAGPDLTTEQAARVYEVLVQEQVIPRDTEAYDPAEADKELRLRNQ